MSMWIASVNLKLPSMIVCQRDGFLHVAGRRRMVPAHSSTSIALGLDARIEVLRVRKPWLSNLQLDQDLRQKENQLVPPDRRENDLQEGLRFQDEQSRRRSEPAKYERPLASENATVHENAWLLRRTPWFTVRSTC